MKVEPPQSHSFRALWRSRGRFVRAVQIFASGDTAGKAKLLFFSLIGLMVAVNTLNVVNSYVGRDFMTAIATQQRGAFILQAVLYVAVFALSTVVAGMYRFAEERLALLWREWLTRHQVKTYLRDHTYYRLREQGEVDNPDQRMAEDTRAFTTTTLSLSLMLLNGTFTILAFSGVLWSISPLLFVAAVLYAALGSLLTLLLGRPLLWLNYNQSDMEANLRADLIHIRENAESIAIQGRENRMSARAQRRIDDLAANMRRVIAINRNVGFFTTGYNYLIQVIPTLIIAPMFMRGEVEFGVITQSSMAFAHLLGAFSLIVTQFQSISSYAAVLARLTALGEATEKVRSRCGVEIIDDEESLAYDRLTLRSPRDDRVLIRELTLFIPSGLRLLIKGSNETAKIALFRATAGIWQWGEGSILRPRRDHVLFLPERPYLPPGTLRELLVRTASERSISDDEIDATLRLLGVEAVAERAGGLQVERDWDNILALGEQQLLDIARVLLARPRYVFLDRIGTALGAEQVASVLRILTEKSITYVTVGNHEDPLDLYDAVVELRDDGEWRCAPIEAGAVATGTASAAGG